MSKQTITCTLTDEQFADIRMWIKCVFNKNIGVYGYSSESYKIDKYHIYLSYYIGNTVIYIHTTTIYYIFTEGSIQLLPDTSYLREIIFEVFAEFGYDRILGDEIRFKKKEL